jgi:hypothetical protein
MGQQNDLKIKCKKLMKVEGLLHKTYGIFVNDYHFANPCFGYRLTHCSSHHLNWSFVGFGYVL